MGSATMFPEDQTGEKKVAGVHQKINPEDKAKLLEQKVEKLVIDILGKPKYFSQIRARNVYSDRWRVDIYCEVPRQGGLTNMPSTEISDSFFIVFRNNEIFRSDPPLKPKYKKKEK